MNDIFLNIHHLVNLFTEVLIRVDKIVLRLKLPC